jgi:uncharacterized protein
MKIKIRYIDGRRLRRSIIASAHRITEMEEELNRINVFPVADGDTGINMASTMRAIIKGASHCPETSLTSVCQCIADSALEGSRGNSGAILAQFFQGLSEACVDKERLSVEAFAAAIQVAVERARAALANPREGTILTVMQDWAEYLQRRADEENDYVALLRDALQRARISLAETPQKLKVLKKAGVVDAGAQGFVHLLEGLSDFIDSGKSAALKARVHIAERIKNFSFFQVRDEVIRFRYCTECLLEGEELRREMVQQKVEDLGDSLIVVGSNHKIRIHIHTNEPQTVFQRLGGFGTVLQTKIEDMQAQNKAALLAEQPAGIALVTDSTCDLPVETLAQYHVFIVPVQVLVNHKTLQDRIDITSREIYSMVKANSHRISTSQPSVAAFLKVYESLVGKFKSVISIHLSGGLSGTLQAAQAAARSFSQRLTIEVIDSRTASVGLGLLVEEAGRLIEQGRQHEEVARLVRLGVVHSRIFVCIPTLKYLMRSGRLTMSRGLFATIVNLKPIITLNQEGKIGQAAKVIGLRRLFEKTIELSTHFADQVANPRFQVAHALDQERAQWFRARLLDKFPHLSIPIVDASPALGLHAGIGSIAVAVMGDPENRLRE